MYKGLVYNVSCVMEKSVYFPMVGNVVLWMLSKSSLLMCFLSPLYFSFACLQNNQRLGEFVYFPCSSIMFCYIFQFYLARSI